MGYQKWINMDSSTGHIKLIARDGVNSLCIPIYLQNNLCYHYHSHSTVTEADILHNNRELFSADGTPVTPTINHLSDAAKWELWHQRLAHPGNRTMEQQHKHADGIPALRGNTFFRCPSCMKNKLCTKRTAGSRNNLATCQSCGGSSRRVASENSSVPSTPDKTGDVTDTEEWDEYLDDLHLPDALPGQHFHIDFGFVRGSYFKVPTGKNGEGPTITSIDTKNSYCIIVDRATRFIWVHLDNTKQPPVNPV